MAKDKGQSTHISLGGKGYVTGKSGAGVKDSSATGFVSMQSPCGGHKSAYRETSSGGYEKVSSSSKGEGFGKGYLDSK